MQNWPSDLENYLAHSHWGTVSVLVDRRDIRGSHSAAITRKRQMRSTEGLAASAAPGDNLKNYIVCTIIYQDTLYFESGSTCFSFLTPVRIQKFKTGGT